MTAASSARRSAADPRPAAGETATPGKIPELVEALTGRFSDHHAFLAQLYLDAIDQHSQGIADLTARIEVVMEPFRAFRDLICTIPPGSGPGPRR